MKMMMEISTFLIIQLKNNPFLTKLKFSSSVRL